MDNRGTVVLHSGLALRETARLCSFSCHHGQKNRPMMRTTHYWCESLDWLRLKLLMPWLCAMDLMRNDPGPKVSRGMLRVDRTLYKLAR